MELVIKNGLFYDGSSEKELKLIKNQYPNKEITILTIRPGEAHIIVYQK